MNLHACSRIIIWWQCVVLHPFSIFLMDWSFIFHHQISVLYHWGIVHNMCACIVMLWSCVCRSTISPQVYRRGTKSESQSEKPCDIGGAIWSQEWCIFLLYIAKEPQNPQYHKRAAENWRWRSQNRNKGISRTTLYLCFPYVFMVCRYFHGHEILAIFSGIAGHLVFDPKLPIKQCILWQPTWQHNHSRPIRRIPQKGIYSLGFAYSTNYQS